MTAQLEQGTAAWLEARAGKVTASVAAACLGLHPDRSRMAAWREITGRGGQPDNPFMAYGREKEGEARNSYEAETGRLATETGFWVHPEHSWLGASPDGLVGSAGLLEVKCPVRLPERVPIHHRIQVLVQLACTGRQWVDYFAWTEQGTFLRRIYPAGTEGLIRRLERFYRLHVLTGIEPLPKRTRLLHGGLAWLEWLSMLPSLSVFNGCLSELSRLEPDEKKQAWKFIHQYASQRDWQFDSSARIFENRRQTA